jgi:hypothetical protein
VLPETVTLNSSPVCAAEAGDAGVPFDPPSAWDGGCTTSAAIASVECDGGVCGASVAPLVLDDKCVPQQAPTPKSLMWGLVAYTCTGTTSGSCNDQGYVCTPKPPTLPPGFSICVSRQGDDPNIKCPDGYPARSVFYVSAVDNRECAPCECGPPQGSSCTSLVSLYADGACSIPVGSVTATSSSATCVTVPAGSSLGSKQAGSPTYVPGPCQPSGGGETGSVQLNDPFTFCCVE